MKLGTTRKAGKFVMAGVAVAAALTMSACSSDPGTTPVTTPAATASASTTAAANTNYPPVPTAADLNAELAKGLDPSVPVEQKAALVQGAQADPDLINQVVAAAGKAGATIAITSVDDLGDGTLNAGATLTVNGAANPFNLSFVAEDGVWKLSKGNACGFLNLAQLTSPACPPA